MKLNAKDYEFSMSQAHLDRRENIKRQLTIKDTRGLGEKLFTMLNVPDVNLGPNHEKDEEHESTFENMEIESHRNSESVHSSKLSTSGKIDKAFNKYQRKKDLIAARARFARYANKK